MNIDQAALVDLFRQSFAPMNAYGAGQLQLAQAALERDYAARVEEQRRAQALRDQIAGITLQNQLLAERETAQRAFTEAQAGRAQQADLVRQLAVSGQAAHLNAAAQRSAAEANDFAELQNMLIGLGVDPSAYDSPDAMRTAAAGAKAKGRNSATEIYRDVEQINAQLEKLAADAELPEARAVQIAKSHLLSAAMGDKDVTEKFKKLTSLDAILEAAGEVGASAKIEDALRGEMALRAQLFERRSRPLQTRRDSLQRTLTTLESKGISPDWESLRAIGTSSSMPTPGAAMPGGAGALMPADLDGIVPVSRGAASPAPASAPVNDAKSNLLAISAGGAGTALAVPAVRSALGRGAATAMRAAPGAAMGAFRAAPYAAPALLGYGLGSAIDNQFDGAISNHLAGVPGGTGAAFDREIGRQKDLLATIRALIPRSEPEVAARLRAATYAPTLNEEALRAALSGMSR